jgi:Na+-transporting NADH:ubiquinone oxidoreductase subunit NqrF
MELVDKLVGVKLDLLKDYELVVDDKREARQIMHSYMNNGECGGAASCEECVFGIEDSEDDCISLTTHLLPKRLRANKVEKTQMRIIKELIRIAKRVKK